MTKMQRCTMTLPAPLVERLDKLAALSGISRSALVSGLLEDSTAMLDAMIQVQAVPSPEGLMRFRGESVQVVNDKLAELKRLLDDDLFSGVARHDGDN